MFAAIALSFGVIFIAELGDKSQLMAMTFALRYRPVVVLAGITAATTAVHAVSVALGHLLGAGLPTNLIGLIAGFAFIGFALWTLRGDSLSAAEQSKASRAGRLTASALLAVTTAFTLAELGDKTMLATVTLAADNNWAGVWIGSTVGMVAADALAIVLGVALGRALPERAVALGAAALFFLFGGILIVSSLEVSGELLIVVAAGLLAAGVGTLIAARRRSLPRPDTERAHLLDSGVIR